MLEFDIVLSIILDELMVDLLELLVVSDEFSILLRLMRDPIDVELEIVLFLTSELLIMERVILVRIWIVLFSITEPLEKLPNKSELLRVLLDSTCEEFRTVAERFESRVLELVSRLRFEIEFLTDELMTVEFSNRDPLITDLVMLELETVLLSMAVRLENEVMTELLMRVEFSMVVLSTREWITVALVRVELSLRD